MMNLDLPSWVLRRQGGLGVETRNVGAVSRRQFFGATGLVLAAGRSNRLEARGQNPHVDASPLPIPGGVSPFGVFIHHFPVISNSTPLAALNEPSQITDFNGFVGANRVRGTGSSSIGPLSFQADMGFMDGVYVANDGKHYRAAFGFIWLDLFQGPVGSNQIHDYNPHTDANGVFWTLALPRNSIEVHFGSGRAAFRLTTQIFDDHDLQSSLTGNFPSGFPQMAEVTFNVEWAGILDRQHVRNEAQNFEGTFLQTGSTIEWSAVNPSTGFQFTSDPPDPAGVVGAVIGRERNGVFFT